MKLMVRRDERFDYYAYALIYVDDVMVIHHDSESVLKRIDKYFILNPSSIGDPDIYLGDKLMKTRLKNGIWIWANRPERYVMELMANVYKSLVDLANKLCQFLKKKAEHDFVGDDETEM